MLQRVQTIFLVLVILFLGASFLFPLWVYADSEGATLYELFNLKLAEYLPDSGTAKAIFFPYSSVAMLTAACITIAAISIGKFNNRLLQMKLGALNAVLMAATLGLSVYFATDLMKTATADGTGQYGIGLFTPAAAMLCNIVANRFIRKDEKLIRSVDRIR